MESSNQKHHPFLVMFVLIFAVTFIIPAFISAGPPIQKSTTDCTYSVEKSKDGEIQYKLEGKGCRAFIDEMKPQSKAMGMGHGDCEGNCHCTYYDNCKCLICRGCCPEILKLSRRSNMLQQ